MSLNFMMGAFRDSETTFSFFCKCIYKNGVLGVLTDFIIQLGERTQRKHQCQNALL